MRTAILISAVFALTGLTFQDDDGVPKDARGFNGQVTGLVTGKTDNGAMLFKVSRVTRVWRNNKATNIEWFLGKTLRIEPNWEKGDDGKHRQVKTHVAFLRRVRKGDDFRLEIQHLEGSVFVITELNEEQRAFARKERGDREDRKDRKDGELPKSLRGFSGQVTGIVTRKTDDGNFLFKVSRVTEVWKDNKAKKPESLAGRTIRVGPRWDKGDDGKWHRSELHVLFIRKLKNKDDYRLEVKNHEASQFSILELTEKQRKWARGKKDDYR